MRKLGFVLLMFVLLFGCSMKVETKQVAVEGANVIGYTELIKDELYYIIDDGDENFATKYNEFLENNTALEVVDVEGDPNNKTQLNQNLGWYIFTKTKETKE